MAKKATPAKTPAAPAKALAPKANVADPIAAAPAPAIVEKSEVKGSGRIAAKAPVGKEITHDMIKQRAHEIWAGRGYAAGNPEADWLEAERQLRAGL